MVSLAVNMLMFFLFINKQTHPIMHLFFAITGNVIIAWLFGLVSIQCQCPKPLYIRSPLFVSLHLHLHLHLHGHWLPALALVRLAYTKFQELAVQVSMQHRRAFFNGSHAIILQRCLVLVIA